MLKAIAFKSGNTNSTVTTGTYTINLPTTAAPAFSPTAGTYTSAQTITITSATSGASIRYTTDGSTPSTTAGTVYTTPVSIASTLTLKAIAFKTGNSNSAVTSGTYTINLPTTAAPAFSPVAATYTSVQTITISSATSGASIRYTTDGSTPSATGGTLYTTPVSIASTRTVKAIAFKTGNANSAVTSGAYTINLPSTVAPTFTPVAGTYTSVQSVTIASATSGASIRYTTDGSTPTTTIGTLYTTPVGIASTLTLKAIAFKTGNIDSAVTSGAYTINLPSTAAPTFSPAAGTYTSVQTVTIASATSGASIRYTTDGSTPSTTVGTLYATPVSIASTLTLKAIAFKTGNTDSAVTSAAYTINLPTTGAPTFSPAAGTYTSVQTVTIVSATSGASIRYTTDGSTPSTTVGNLYSAPVSIASTLTLKAIAFKTGNTDSAVTSGVYSINLPTAAPTFSPDAGTYTSVQTVTLSSATGGASIRYTTNGSTPSTTAGTPYTTPVSIASTTTLKAIAFKSGSSNSAVTTGLYTITLPKAGTPIFDHTAGSYGAIITVAITSTSSGDSIAYTTDGTTPTESNGSVTHGTLYSAPFIVDATTTVKAIAFARGFSDSSVRSVTYTIILPVSAAPILFPTPGTYATTQSVTMTSATSGALIAYTLDGTTPTVNRGTITHGSLYSTPLTISGPTTLTAISYELGYTSSAAVGGLYAFGPAASSPVFSPAPGTYPGQQNVTMTSVTSGVSIVYTTDGSTPTETHGTLYSSPININTTTRLKAMAYKASSAGDSALTNGLYTLTSSLAPTVDVMYDFTPSNSGGIYPNAALLEASDGSFYGTTYGSGSNKGTVFKIAPTGVFTPLITFNNTNGANPQAELIQGSDGSFYGTTQNGGYANDGTVFKMTAAGALTTLYEFSVDDGATPNAGLVQGSDGSYYGTTTYGGAIDGSTLRPGTIFKMGAAGDLAPIFFFNGTNGKLPMAALTQGSDGAFYGTTGMGGRTNEGTVFKMTPNGILTTLFHFNGSGGQGPGGWDPNGKLILGNDNNFYGVTYLGGTTDNGEVFKLTPNGDLSVLASFGGTNGINPIGGLTKGANGNFYGTTTGGYQGNAGALFEVTPTGVLTSLFSFNGVNGSNPWAGLIQGKDGNFYGTTVNGGAYNSGVIFRLNIPTVASPVFVPAPGVFYTTAQPVAISSGTPGVVIRYTTDGSMPSKTDGTIYSTAVNLAGATTLRAIAFVNGMDDSAVTSGQYTVGPQAAAPIFGPAPGSYTSTQTVAIGAPSSGTTIAYTTDGSTPTETSGTVTHGILYSGPLTLFGPNVTLKAIAFGPGFLDSTAMSGVYTNANPPPPAPVISSNGGTFTSTQVVTITCAGANAIYYTTDGTMPTLSSPLYTSALPISNNATLQAVGVNAGGSGPIASVSFTILPVAPILNPAPGTYANVSTLSVTLDSGPIPTIYYTTDGTVPTPASNLYAGTISLSPGTTKLRAIAVNSNGVSAIAEGEYILAPLASTPVLSLSSGTYTGTQVIAISSTDATVIYYTTDGSVPTSSSPRYSGPVPISTSTTLRAIGINSAGSSQVASSIYTITGLPSAPVFGLAPGTYGGVQLLGITSADATSIYYTTDGTIPTSSSPLYGGPISISTNTTIRAVGINGIGVGTVTSGRYLILPIASAPLFSPAPGAYPEAQNVTITSATTGASIVYTTDGSTPTGEHGKLYSGPVTLNSTMALKAIAYVTDSYGNSTATTGIYTIANTPSGVLNVLYNLTTTHQGWRTPFSGLILGADGNFYGTTSGDYGKVGGGVFRITPGGVFTNLVTFGGTRGSGPVSLVQARDGNFYGTTFFGGVNDSGAVFRLTPAGILTTMVSFNGTNGASPLGLIQGTDGNFYGTTASGGLYRSGTIFEMSASGDLTTLVSLNGADQNYSSGSLVQGDDGNLYGSTWAPYTGGSSTIFRVTPPGLFTRLITFDPSNGGGYVGLIRGNDGNIYGTTSSGGSAGYGTVFQMTTSGVLSTLFSFTSNNASPNGGLVQGSDGNFYGTTQLGGWLDDGTGGYGTLFKLTSSGVLTSWAPFIGSTVTGGYPTGMIVQGRDGNIYGMTETGGVINGSENFHSGCGVVFQFVLPATATPVLSPTPGSYNAAQTLTISTTTAGALIRYTTDGSTPSKTNGIVYSGPFQVKQSGFLQAIAYSPGLADSPVTDGLYAIYPPASSPMFTPVSGSYSSPQTVSITSPSPGTAIRYTIDGSVPTESNGILYSGPVSVGGTLTLQAIAYDGGFSDSNVSVGTFAISVSQQVAAPVFSANGVANSVIISAAPLATIRFTTDGSTPTEINGIIYTGPVSITKPTVLKAIAYQSGFTDSPVTSATIGIPTITIVSPGNGATINN